MPTVNSVTVSEANGLTFLNINNEKASAKVSLFGGHILSFIPKGDNKERLWVSPHAYLNGERPIRGGIPICWPWFGDDHGREKGTLPSHGYLRTQMWKLAHSEDTVDGTKIELQPSFTRAEGFEFDCKVTLIIEVGNELSLSLITENTGVVPFDYNCALHTYFHVDHIENTRLKGIDGDYKDKVDDFKVKATPVPYVIDSETDRIHLNPIAHATIEVNDQDVTRVDSVGNDSLVVWNPWQGAASISDMDAFGYKHMLCVESAITQGKTLSPGEQHMLTQRVIPQ
ncbi:D-hexose-6-phosphate mutarotase [Alteromonas sp. D210916BOD_24]|uniref:D-hexose-6-phosphate mutarotase n=1 Tax=Alteromonas sp. D210916BOD_24 TaxID=3157618 RepID=UPI00399CAC5E